MIAIFTQYPEEFERFRLTPRKNFRIVKSINDIRGITFTGAIMIGAWYNDNKLADAYEALYIRQPEILTP